MSQSLVAEDEDVRQSCFTKSAEEPGGVGQVCTFARWLRLVFASSMRTATLWDRLFATISAVSAISL